MFSTSPTYRVKSEMAKAEEGSNESEEPVAEPAGAAKAVQTEAVQKIAWFDSAAPLRSGWAWGQEHLSGGIAIAEAKVGSGRLVLFGPQIVFRAQPHGTFKFLFNGIVQAGMEE